MRSARIVTGVVALVSALVACGGQVDEGTSPDALPGLPPGMAETTAPPSSPRSGPEQVAADVGVPSAIATTTDAVVFTTSATKIAGELVQAGALFVADKRLTGVAPLMIHVDRQGASFDALTVEGDRAFVATSDGRLLSAPLAGGAVTEVAHLDAPAAALAATRAHVFAASADGAIVRVARDGGNAEALGTFAGPVQSLVVGDGAVFAAVTTSDTRGAIRAIDLATRAVSDLAADVPAPCAMAREGERLFWTSTGGVMGLATTGGAPISIAAGSFEACAIATDGASLFFATRAEGVAARDRGASVGLGLMRAPASGGVPTPVVGAAAALAQPGAVATDASYLYWLTGSGVLRMRK